MSKKQFKDEIAKVIYNNLNYMYCDNCRYNREISEEESIKNGSSWGCEDCHRKYNGWGISMSASKGLSKKILEILE